MLTTTAAAGVAAHHLSAKMVLLAVERDPTDAKKAFDSTVRVTCDVANSVKYLGYAIWYRDTSYMTLSGRSLVSAPVDAVDVVVYSVAALTSVIPKSDVLLPIGWAWSRLRGHK